MTLARLLQVAARFAGDMHGAAIEACKANGMVAHYEELAAEIDDMLARDEARGRVADAMYRSREALLDSSVLARRGRSIEAAADIRALTQGPRASPSQQPPDPGSGRFQAALAGRRPVARALEGLDGRLPSRAFRREAEARPRSAIEAAMTDEGTGPHEPASIPAQRTGPHPAARRNKR